MIKRVQLYFSALVLFSVLSAGTMPAEQPNIVIIYADDMGYGDLGAQNADSKIPTPNLDRLASQGMRFTDAHSSSGICTPSRYALLTGRYHWRKFHNIVQSWGDSVFDAQRLTLPEMLQEKGYNTACIGKWHLGFRWAAIRKPGAKPTKVGNKMTYRAEDFDWRRPIPNGPLAHGFDHYFGDDVPNFPPYAWIQDDRVMEAPAIPYVPDPAPAEGSPEGRPGPMVKGWKQDAVMPALTKHAVEWIGQQKGTNQPFFLYWPWTSPHAPIVPAADWKGKTNAGGYGDFMTQSDHHAGELLRALEANGFSDNTIVIFTADNGPEKYAFDRVRKYQHSSPGNFRGLKRDIWEGGHRVPLIVRWPGVVPAGKVSHDLMSQVDIMATLAAVVNYELPKNAADDSHNQLALWKGGDGSRKSMVHNTRQNHYAIRHGDWVLIDAPSGTISKPPAWFSELKGYTKNPHPGALYNLATDRSQLKNVFQDHPERVKQLKELLAKTRKTGEVRSE